jgi:Uma2 family endonuclease
MGALPAAKLSVEEYLALDRAAEVPSEYHDGEMFPIESVSVAHARLSIKVGGCLDRQLHGAACTVLGSALRVRVSPTRFVIPDLMVFCGKPALTDEHHDTITNPRVIIEILSPSTADYDYGKKFILYRGLPSFEEYVLVSQDQARVETYRKTDAERWVLSTYKGLDSVVPVECLGVTLPLTEIYRGVELPALVDD